MESKIYKVNVINHTKINDHIEYVLSIENIQKGNNFSFTERYTILRNLYELMKKKPLAKIFHLFLQVSYSDMRKKSLLSKEKKN